MNFCFFLSIQQLTEKSESGKHGGCFDENSIVYDRKGAKPIKDLQIGDEILSVGSDGKLQYSEVIMFLDRDQTGERLYYRFETESGSTITTTPSHLLYVNYKVTNVANLNQGVTLGRPEFAKDIQVGQYLYIRRENNQIVLERVVKKISGLGRGAFAPLTAAGNLIVNNVTASCYAVIGSQTLAHWSFMPIRWAHLVAHFGDSLSGYLLAKSGTSRVRRESWNFENFLNLSDNQESGIHWYPRLLYSIFKHMIPSQWMYN